MPLPTNNSFDSSLRLPDLLNAIGSWINGRTPQALAANPVVPPIADGHTVFVSAAAPWTLVLPPVASCAKGARLTFVKTDANANAITLDGNGAETINNSNVNATLLAAQFGHGTLETDQVAWYIVA